MGVAFKGVQTPSCGLKVQDSGLGRRFSRAGLVLDAVTSPNIEILPPKNIQDVHCVKLHSVLSIFDIRGGCQCWGRGLVYLFLQLDLEGLVNIACESRFNNLGPSGVDHDVSRAAPCVMIPTWRVRGTQ